MGTIGVSIFPCSSFPASWMMPPIAATLITCPALRSIAFDVASPSVSSIRARAAPPAAITALDPTRQARGELLGAILLARRSTLKPMASAANTVNPAAIP
jgi:hypothetical protein